MKVKTRTILPGFRLTLGFTVFYLCLIVLIPISTAYIKSTSLSPSEFWKVISSPRAVASYRLTFGASLVAALLNAFFGLLIAWVLTRYRFFGKRIFDALVDLPFAFPTAVAGISLTTLYAPNGWLGKIFAHFGIEVSYTPLGIILALTFVGLPFAVRTIQPVIGNLNREIEEASFSLGASSWQTFRRILIPELMPGIVAGFTLAFARALGEYGSVLFIAGNLPMKTEITPLLIVAQLEQYRYGAATALAVVMLTVAFVLLFIINLLQKLINPPAM